MSLAKETGTRKLAAVMFTDIKGFSKKMSENEAAAFELLKTHDALMRVIAAKYDGKVVKSIGDSFMVDFSSAVNAVKAGVDAQKRFWSFNRGKGEFDKIEIRIGIHLGDVMTTGNDMYGDGVNIASRIEAITEPTRICISSDMYNQVKNKMDIKVHSLGPISLKNIPEPVEVFEVLIDSIPELAKPSRAAKQMMAQKQVEDAAEVESEEANSIEEARKRGSTPVPTVLDTSSLIEAQYKKAEQLYNQGKIDEAERVINEIAALDPGYHAAMEKKKAEDEKEKLVREHYERAGAYLRDGRFDLAEKEVKEIFTLYPLHVGAQQLQLQIEDERYRKSEEERQQRLDQERKTREVKDHKVEELARKTETYIEQEQFKEAHEGLQSIYSLEPNFTGGERLEEKLRRAEAAQQDRERQQSFLTQQVSREDILAQNRERQAERQQVHVAPRLEETKTPKPWLKYIFRGLAIVAILAFGYWSAPRIKKILFPPSASIAVLPFNNSLDTQGEDALTVVLPGFVARDLAHTERMQIVLPSRGGIRSSDYLKVATELQVRYLLHGSVLKTDRGFSINIRLYDSEQQADLFSERFETDFAVLNQTRQQIAAKILSQLTFENPAPSIPSLTTNAIAYEQYLNGLALMRTYSLPSLERAHLFFEESTRLDSTFASAYEGLSEVHMRRFNLESPKDENLLKEAFDLAQRALRLNAQAASSYRTLAELYFLSRRFDKVEKSVQSSLAIQPEDAECYGILAQLAIVGGNYELASSHAVHAAKNEPDNPDIQLVLGLTAHFKKSYPDAVAAYKRAIILGLSDSLITTHYLLNAWMSADDFSDVIQYCQNGLNEHPDNYRYYYWISRAYILKPSISDFNIWAEKGTKLLGEYLDKNPLDASAHAYLGLLLSREGKAEEGETEMKKALALAPTSTTILFREANLYALQKKSDLAIAALKEALNKEYSFTEILNPDFALIRHDAPFISAITRNTESR